MKCQDNTDIWRLCTPFNSKISNAMFYPFTFSFFTEHCISDVGYTDDGEECSTSCGLEHGGLSKLHNWCWTVNTTLKWDYCTPIPISKWFQILAKSLNFLSM